MLETPNRLRHTDTHTAWLPFYHWLPDELAFKYARFSERTNFREGYGELTDERLLHFCRRGRGVSFHRFQIAAWTIVLGIIFVTQVYKVLAMPDFNGSLLALLGISAGTYIGLKIPEATVPK